MAVFDLSLRTRATLYIHGEPSDFITDYHGEVICTDEDTGAESVAGHVHAQKLHVELATNQGESLFDVCDSHSHELHVLHALLFEPDGYDLRPPLVDRFDVFGGDVLILDYVLLDPKWRGLRVGLLAARKVIDLLGGGCGLAVSAIAPLRRAAHQRLGVPREWIPRTTKASRGQALIGLRSYFRRMGFERLGRSPYYALSTTQTNPTGGELLRPRSSGHG